MIDLGRPSLHGEGVTIFGDHAQSNRFYCLADRPRVRTSSDGVPELMLLKYRLDPTLHQALGAGLLSLTVDLGIEPTLLEKLRRRLSLRDGLSGPVEIGPVMAESGSCQLVLINRSSSDQDSNTSASGALCAGGKNSWRGDSFVVRRQRCHVPGSAFAGRCRCGGRSAARRRTTHRRRVHVTNDGLAAGAAG